VTFLPLRSLVVACALLIPTWAQAQDDSTILTPQQRAFVKSIPVSSGPLDNRSGKFDTRYVEAPFDSVEAIYENPTVTNMAMKTFPDGRVEAQADVHGIFPVEPMAMARAIATYGQYNLISHRTIFSEDRSPAVGPFEYHKQIQMISASFLGIGKTYLFVTNDYSERLSSSSYGFKWNLERSFQNAFYLLDGSWYLRAVAYQGRACTYVRYFNQTGFNQPPPIPLPILQHFIALDYKRLLTDTFHRAVEMSSETEQLSRR